MIEDLSDHPSPSSFDADVAIVGAGAAGITLARQLAKAKVSVCLLESGGRDFERPVQDLADGDSVGFPYYPLAESRLRFFGGTTAIWGGRAAELDPIDFERRPWVSDSGWPFGKEAIAPYYRRAAELFDLPAAMTGARDDDPAASERPVHGLDLDRSLIATSCWWFDQRFERFTAGSCDDLATSSLVRVLLHATVVKIVSDTTASDGAACRVTALEIASLNGQRGTVRAKSFVLATGGIETPRLLLAQAAMGEETANGEMTNGQAVGNEHDLVGRYFAEHPRARGGRVVTDQPWSLLKAMPRLQRSHGHLRAGVLRGADRLQQEHGLLNSAFALAVRKPPDGTRNVSQRLYSGIKHSLPPDRFGRWLWQRWRRSQILAREMISLPRGLRRLKTGGYGLYVVMRGEQAPNPSSRVTLGDERDALSMPRARLDWRFDAIEKHTVRVLMSTFDRELERLGLGRLEMADWLSDGADGASGQDEETPLWETDALLGNHPIAGYHHIGTTRMASSAKQGVVDADCRVHSRQNLYIAGSSVFPTSGWANPTLTILALTLKLADHLLERRSDR